ncbi:hypothetical protein KBD34_01990 [Patescibacteria group bacterium]|nr:hypothetical protein [Patescibacteria group bacterium]
MGLSLITALEIFTNPDDLYFAVIKDPESGKYGLVIARGPGHDYKPLFDVSCNYETREGVLEMLRTGLSGTREGVIKELGSSSSLVAAIFKPPAGQPLEEVGLTQTKVDEIIEALTTRDTFLTSRPNSAPADRLAETVELVERIADATT